MEPILGGLILGLFAGYKIKKCKREENLKSLRKSSTGNVKSNDLNKLSDKELQKIKEIAHNYEEKVSQIFSDSGYKVINNSKKYGFKDSGVDLIGHNNNELVLLQCKYYKNKQLSYNDIFAIYGKMDIFTKRKRYNSYEEIRSINSIKNVKNTLVIPHSDSLSFGAKKALDEINTNKFQNLVIEIHELKK